MLCSANPKFQLLSSPHRVMTFPHEWWPSLLVCAPFLAVAVAVAVELSNTRLLQRRPLPSRRPPGLQADWSERARAHFLPSCLPSSPPLPIDDDPLRPPRPHREQEHHQHHHQKARRAVATKRNLFTPSPSSAAKKSPAYKLDSAAKSVHAPAAIMAPTNDILSSGSVVFALAHIRETIFRYHAIELVKERTRQLDAINRPVTEAFWSSFPTADMTTTPKEWFASKSRNEMSAA